MQSYNLHVLGALVLEMREACPGRNRSYTVLKRTSVLIFWTRRLRGKTAPSVSGFAKNPILTRRTGSGYNKFTILIARQ